MEWSWTGGKAAATTLRAHDDIALTPTAALDTHSEFIALDPVHPRTLQCGLDDFTRNYCSCCRGALQVELSAADSRLDSHRLGAIKHLLLVGSASRNR